MKIIGLTGLARSGKDTVGRMGIEWCEDRGIKAKRLSLADPLKISAAACFGIPADEAVEWCNRLKGDGWSVQTSSCLTGPEESVSGREFLQLYGTEAHRDVFGQDFWTEQAAKAFARMESAEGVDVAFVTDVRFANEAEMVRRWGGEVWHITRPQAGLANGLEKHSSEAGVPAEYIDQQLLNNSTVTELREYVNVLCELTIDLTEAK